MEYIEPTKEITCKYCTHKFKYSFHGYVAVYPRTINCNIDDVVYKLYCPNCGEAASTRKIKYAGRN